VAAPPRAWLPPRASPVAKPPPTSPAAAASGLVSDWPRTALARLSADADAEEGRKTLGRSGWMILRLHAPPPWRPLRPGRGWPRQPRQNKQRKTQLHQALDGSETWRNSRLAIAPTATSINDSAQGSRSSAAPTHLAVTSRRGERGELLFQTARWCRFARAARPVDANNPRQRCQRSAKVVQHH